MLASLIPRSRISRSLLILLAWAALTFDVFAYPLVVVGEATGTVSMTMDEAVPSHCDGMAMTHSSHPAPSHPSDSGHGCCQNDSCRCASLCNGIACMPSLDTALRPARDRALGFVPLAPGLAHSAPPLPPPIV
jgi:hypothetical protein